MALKRIYQNKSELLLVLNRPDVPLHNNLSERDIREYVKKRKISGSTRNDAGKGNHLVALCQILSVGPESFFKDDSSEVISIPVHRTRKNAKVNEHMQQDALMMVEEYKILFKNIADSVVVPVIRTKDRDESNAIRIAEELRKLSGVQNDNPMDYADTFRLLHELGIITIFRYFPDSVKDYAFYTRIFDNRVVFVNNSTNVLDLIFPVLHEAVHAIRDEVYTNGTYDSEEEDFCDYVASYVQFPEDYVRFIQATIDGLPVSHKINKLKMFGTKNAHSLYGVHKRLKYLDKTISFNVGGADTNLKKEFPSIGDILFENDDPNNFLDLLSTLSPRFIKTIKDQVENFSSRKVGQLMGLESALDGKEIKKILSDN